MIRVSMLFAISTAVLASGCTQQPPPITAPAVPLWMTEPVSEPAIPNPETATQRSVAQLIVAQRSALQTCNAQLLIIKDWSQQWTQPTTQRD